MNRWPNRADVCLEAGKTASRHKTKLGNRSETGRKGQKSPPQGENKTGIRGFSAACKARIDSFGFMRGSELPPASGFSFFAAYLSRTELRDRAELVDSVGRLNPKPGD
jgi:hypothetical protein